MSKRLFDAVVAFFLLCVFSPFLLCVSVVLLCVQGRPVLFTQPRPGLNGVVFKLKKFRTMSVHTGKDCDESSKSDGMRLTAIGRFIRSTSIDELPTLFNVLKGEMSLVGPRPLLVAYLPRYNAYQNRRHEIRPGITGWAQIHGRNNLSWSEKFSLDVWYVDNQSTGLDMKILFKTVLKVVRRSDINQAGFDTAEEFYGNKPIDTHHADG